MAHFVVSGKTNDKFFAKAQLLANVLSNSLPYFQVEIREFTTEPSWLLFLQEINSKYNWNQVSSPVIWRQAALGNPTPTLLGGFLEFSGYVKKSYGFELPQDIEVCTTVDIDTSPGAVSVAMVPGDPGSTLKTPSSVESTSSVSIAILNADHGIAYSLLPAFLTPLTLHNGQSKVSVAFVMFVFSRCVGVAYFDTLLHVFHFFELFLKFILVLFLTDNHCMSPNFN
eukprot:m.88953 g.88953  ORF g.88953 m.88953 type:complete len:226 (-) comp12872_c0_seq3:113-790(-)